MLTMSKITRLYFFLFFFTLQFGKEALAKELILEIPSASVRVVMKGGKVSAMDAHQRKSYIVSNSLADHLKKSFEVTLINTYNYAREPMFFILIREPSRPSSMGQGYCGAGYEDFLLLVKFDKKTFTLNDEYLLQSCLLTKSMRIEQSSMNPQDGLRLNADGSYDFEIVEDDYGEMRNIKIFHGKFITKKISEKYPKIPK